MKTGFKIDEDLSSDVADALKGAGFDAETVLEEDMLGINDQKLFATVLQEGRILVTADKGFADQRLFSPDKNSGIVIFRLRRESRAAYVRLAEQLATIDPATLLGAMSIQTPVGIRIRRNQA